MSVTNLRPEPVNMVAEAIEQFESLAEEKKELTAQQTEICTRLRDNGYNVTAFRKLIQLRKLEPEQRAEVVAEMNRMAGMAGMQMSLSLGGE